MLPVDASGTPIATEMCDTSYEYASGTLATTSQVCYRQKDVYTDYLIEFAFLLGTLLIILAIVGAFKRRNIIMPISMQNKK